MEQISSDPYEQKLYHIFKSHDYNAEGSLEEEALTKLCKSLELNDKAHILVKKLLVQSKDKRKISFREFKDGLLQFLGNEMSQNGMYIIYAIIFLLVFNIFFSPYCGILSKRKKYIKVLSIMCSKVKKLCLKESLKNYFDKEMFVLEKNLIWHYNIHSCIRVDIFIILSSLYHCMFIHVYFWNKNNNTYVKVQMH